jgi:hypothetical protein
VNVKNCRLTIRHFRHVKKRAKAKKALTRLRTIANTHFKNKIKAFNAYTLSKVHQLGGIARHTWYIVLFDKYLCLMLSHNCSTGLSSGA